MIERFLGISLIYGYAGFFIGEAFVLGCLSDVLQSLKGHRGNFVGVKEGFQKSIAFSLSEVACLFVLKMTWSF